MQAIFIAATRAEALTAHAQFLDRYGAKYPKDVEKPKQERDSLLTFFDFPAEHWQHLRPIRGAVEIGMLLAGVPFKDGMPAQDKPPEQQKLAGLMALRFRTGIHQV